MLVLCGGCRGGGKVQFVPLNYRDVAESQPLVWAYDLDECYWWRDEAGKIHVAAGFVHGSLGGEGNQLRFSLTMDLDEPPAGRARTYSVRGRTIHAVASRGYASNYFQSIYGVVGVWTENKKAFRLRCRVLMMQRNFTPLFGYSRSGQTLLLGEFRAVRDKGHKDRSEAIRAHAAEAASGGSPAATSQPASRPAGGPVPSRAREERPDR